MAVICENCKQQTQLDAKEITGDWQYHTHCKCCGQEQFGSLYLGFQFPSDNLGRL